MMEIWKDIKGYEGKYQISNLGNVKSLKDSRGNFREKLLKLQKDTKGYLRIQLFKNGKGETKKVHRLVAEAFIPNPNNLPEVNHIKEFEKDNNIVENLEWVTSKQNSNHGTRNYRMGKSHSRTVYQYSINGDFIKMWPSTMECGRNGFDRGHVGECCLGKRKTHNGYIWSYTPIMLDKERLTS